MDDKFKNLSFKDFTAVDYAQMNDELIAYRRKRLKNGAMHEDADGESVEHVGEDMDVDEALSNAQRLKVSQRMKRLSKKMVAARQRAMKKAPSTEQIKKRANKQARNLVKMKLTKGVPPNELSMGQRAELEKKMAKKGAAVNKLARKLQIKIKKDDQERRKKEKMSEDMDVGQRRKAGQRMKRMANRIKIAKKKSMKRTPTGDVVDKRARKQARAELGKKLSGGKSTSDLSVAQRRQVGKKVNKQQGRLDSLTKRKRPEVRKMHRDRMSSANKAD